MSERLYFHLIPHECPTLSAKIIYIIIRLTRAPHDFFGLMVEDFIKHENEAERKESTNKLFQTYTNLESGIRQLYGNQNEKRDTEDEIAQLAQTGATTAYYVKFQYLITQTGQNNNSLIAQFYRGLKDDVKDELVKAEWPDILAEFTEGAIKIDSRNHIRRLEKVQKGKAPIKPNTPIKRREKTIAKEGNAINLNRIQT